MQETYLLTLNIKRYDPDKNKSWVQQYQIEVGRILRFVDVFRKINSELDPTLAWSSSCEHAQCGTCAVIINGRPRLTCELLVENAVRENRGTIFNIEPITSAPVIRDLVVDMEKAFERIEKIKPYIIGHLDKRNEAEEYRVSVRDMDPYIEATRCVNCFCCATACISSNNGFIGPNAVMASVVRLMDPREISQKERLRFLFSTEGVYRCHTSKACSFVCPKNIDVAHFIALAKENPFLDGLDKK